MIVISTARGNADAVRKCCQSVQAAGLRHRFAAADGAAFGAAVGPCEFVIHSPAPQLENLRMLVSSIEPHEIVAWLDGDDVLLPEAVEQVERAHRCGALVTYGAFRYEKGLPDYTLGKYFRTRYPGPEYGPGRFRGSAWRAAHLRTFRAHLFARIPEEHFRRADGTYLEHCIDRAVMLPLLEIAGERYTVIEKEIVEYNTDHFRAMSVQELRDERADLARVHGLKPLEPLP